MIGHGCKCREAHHLLSPAVHMHVPQRFACARSLGLRRDAQTTSSHSSAPWIRRRSEATPALEQVCGKLPTLKSCLSHAPSHAHPCGRGAHAVTDLYKQKR